LWFLCLRVNKFTERESDFMSGENEKKRILIVEDDMAMQEIYKVMFQSRSDRYDIEIFGDARLALRVMKEDHVALIILDIYMEPMEGDIFFTCVREDKDIPNVPVLVISVIDPSRLEHFKKMGNVEFLKKPVEEEHLMEKIEEMIG